MRERSGPAYRPARTAAAPDDGATTAFPIASSEDRRRPRGAHRIPAPSPAARGRVVVAAVTMGALAAAGAGLASEGTSTTTADGDSGSWGQDGPDARAAMGVGGRAASSPEVLLMARSADPSQEAAKLAASGDAIAAKEAAEAEARRPKFVLPAQGRISSGYGSRWGAFHGGIDVANAPYTPIVAAADGVIIDAGPASGFGLWVREKLADGTILVYGHMHDYSVSIGQHVKAGEQIARMGERGHATGYHLHFEVWNPGGQKINPVPWLHEHGLSY